MSFIVMINDQFCGVLRYPIVLGNLLNFLMTIIRLLLFPFSVLYDLVTRFRNHLYDIGYSKAFNFEVMVINVGNLRVGGTGKTPMVEYLIRLMADSYPLVTLSRGYKRKSTGFLLANDKSIASDIGDEPYQMLLKFGGKAHVAVGEERALAIPSILLELPDTKVIVMDDGFQHRTVSPDFNILLTEYARPFYQDFVLPGGRLRESRKGANRANVVVVTKSPVDLSSAAMEEMTSEITHYAGKTTPVFFTHLVYGELRGVNSDKSNRDQRYLVFSGLANPEAFENKMRKSYDVVQSISFSDHHNYTEKDIGKLAAKARDLNAALLTTEKDMVKLKSSSMLAFLKGIDLYYVPVWHEFIKNGNIFDAAVLNSIASKQVEEEC